LQAVAAVVSRTAFVVNVPDGKQTRRSLQIDETCSAWAGTKGLSMKVT
jgi:hypothetical protein